MTPRNVKPAPRSALLIVDMINPLDFPGAPALLRQSIPVATRIERLKRRMKSRGQPAIYVNDNFSHWLRDFHELVLATSVRARNSCSSTVWVPGITRMQPFSCSESSMASHSVTTSMGSSGQ